MKGDLYFFIAELIKSFSFHRCLCGIKIFCKDACLISNSKTFSGFFLVWRRCFIRPFLFHFSAKGLCFLGRKGGGSFSFFSSTKRKIILRNSRKRTIVKRSKSVTANSLVYRCLRCTLCTILQDLLHEECTILQDF